MYYMISNSDTYVTYKNRRCVEQVDLVELIYDFDQLSDYN